MTFHCLVNTILVLFSVLWFMSTYMYLILSYGPISFSSHCLRQIPQLSSLKKGDIKAK
jgi:hypothetical protein